MWFPLSRFPFLVRPILVLILGMALVMTPIAEAQARPARASSHDFLAAMVALGLIGLIASNETGKQRAASSVPAAKRIPGKCLRNFRTPRGNRAMVERRCLQDNFRWWRSLPWQCETRVRVERRSGRALPRRGYQPDCLRDFGYRIER